MNKLIQSQVTTIFGIPFIGGRRISCSPSVVTGSKSGYGCALKSWRVLGTEKNKKQPLRLLVANLLVEKQEEK